MEVFGRLRVAELRLKPQLCNLVKQEVKYLGYMMLSNEISAHPDKVTAIQDYPRLQTIKQLRSFWGLPCNIGILYPTSHMLLHHSMY